MKKTVILSILAVLVPFIVQGQAGGKSVSLNDNAAYGFKAFMWQTESGSLPYRLYIPAKLEQGKKYPLVLFFHGMGSIGSDNKKQLFLAKNFATPEVQKKYPCFVLAPQCPTTGRWVKAVWGADVHKMAEKPTPEMTMAMELVKATAKDYPVDEKRIYVSGASMGGFATWEIISRMPDFFAAAVPVCGGGDLANAGKIAVLPIWAFHGTLDPVVKVQSSRSMVGEIKKSGGSPLYTEYPDVKHDAWNHSYKEKDIYDWMFKQVKNK